MSKLLPYREIRAKKPLGTWLEDVLGGFRGNILIEDLKLVMKSFVYYLYHVADEIRYIEDYQLVQFRFGRIIFQYSAGKLTLHLL